MFNLIAAIYSRKSKFTVKGESVENQVHLCKEYAKRMNIETFLIYEDEGFSGKNVDRPQFQKMLQEAKDKKFNVLICYKLDRVSRNISDFLNLIEELQNLNIDFISIKEQFDTSTPIGRAMMYITSVFAQLERETIGERVRDNMLELSKTGRWLGGQTPFGYESSSITYFDSSMNEKKMYILTPIVEELEVVKLIYKLYLEEKSLSQVHKYLYSHNIKTKLGKDWTVKKVQLMLRSPLYVKSSSASMEYLQSQGMILCGEPNGNGVLLYNKTKNIRTKREKSQWIAAVSKHPGIIDSDSWLLVQSILDKNKEKAPRLGKCNEALLTGIIKCSLCGSNMYIKHGHFSSKTGKRIQYYVCSNKENSRGTRCNNPNVRRDEIEAHVLISMQGLKIKESLLINTLRNTRCYDHNFIEDEDFTFKEIKIIEKKIENLLDQLSLNPSLSKFIVPKVEELNNTLENLYNKKNSQLRENKNSLINNNILYKSSLENFWHLLTYKEKKLILESLIESIYFNGRNGELVVNFHRKKEP